MFNRKDLLGTKDLTKDELFDLFKLANQMKKHLLDRTVNNELILTGNMTTLFYENSTRTKHSFTAAGQNVGLNVSDLAVGTSSVKKGESLYDTAATIDAMCMDIIVIRHSSSGTPHFLANNVQASIINAGDGINEHPTQALLDCMTILEKKGSFDGLNVCITGDIIHSRVAKSNFYALKTLGANITFAGPNTLLPKSMKKLGATICYDIKEAVKNADVVMGLRVQLERQKNGAFPDLREYHRHFGITEEIFRLAKKNAILMHPAPVNRGVEIQSCMVEAPFSTIKEQVTNGVAMRMAIIKRIMEARKKSTQNELRRII